MNKHLVLAAKRRLQRAKVPRRDLKTTARLRLTWMRRRNCRL